MIAPAICQKMFSGFAPPVSCIVEPTDKVKVPVTCRIQISSGPPSKVIILLVLTVSVDTHLCRPGVRVCPSRTGPGTFKKCGFKRVAASVYAAIMSPIARVILAGVGIA